MIKRLDFLDKISSLKEMIIKRGNRASPQTVFGQMRGTVIAKDVTTGKVLFEKDNIIVLRGRVFALEKLFHDEITDSTVSLPSESPIYQSGLDRKVVAFGVGKGGADITNPFEPFAPEPNLVAGRMLADQIPFRYHDETRPDDGPLVHIPVEERDNYGGGISSGDGVDYMLKHFDQRDPSWVFSDDLNEVYKKIQLFITKDDCRTQPSNWINELGLYFALYDSANLDSNDCSIFQNYELFSRITFPTEYMSPEKEIAIEYRIYS